MTKDSVSTVQKKVSAKGTTREAFFSNFFLRVSTLRKGILKGLENFIFSYKGSLTYIGFNFICSKSI